MKKLNKAKIASFLAVLTLTAVPYIKLPDSLLLWGEPTPPMEKEEN